MNIVKANDIAYWFIKKGYDSPRDTFDGNMKLQKLLFFAQLIHYAKHNKLLFSDEMKAFENGTVINDVRLNYKHNLYSMIMESENSDEFNDCEIKETLDLTCKIFGDMSASELSDLNHELISWKIAFNSSKTDIPGVYNSEKNTIKIDKYFLEDVQRMKDMLDAFEDENEMAFEVINGVTFYYNPNLVNFTEDLQSKLEGMNFPDDAYTIIYDEEQGIIIT
jgi:uncharacterized phage-associated protein